MAWDNTQQPGYRDITEAEFQQFMASHESGASVQEIADFLGLSRVRVNVILVRALVKLRTACQERDISPADMPTRSSYWDNMQL